jgi:hypothetical protein
MNQKVPRNRRRKDEIYNVRHGNEFSRTWRLIKNYELRIMEILNFE